eukprot:CAMPEP_0196222824 /NCGR_PEP_ID=MMETSP0912-20130531/45488_1 /TAXON_ID=49265 /ORGANISM="Thalassiosira rotula, Strain GSO102" /LENGTH=184 /DNA_ID=CAMNT_0041501719 /DNA_START=153 /DNA_END=707 /DNA_ORIENTATION=+
MHKWCPLVKQISPGDRIIAIDGEDVSGMDVKEVESILARKVEFERRLEALRGMPASSNPPKNSDAASAAEARENANDRFLGNPAEEIANGSVSIALNTTNDCPTFGNAAPANAVLKAPAPNSLSFEDTQQSTASSSTTKPVYATSQSSKYSSIPQEKSSSTPSAMASEAPLEPADADISEFMSC